MVYGREKQLDKTTRKAITKLLKNIEILRSNDDAGAWRDDAPTWDGWRLSGDLWKYDKLCDQNKTSDIRRALRELDIIEEKIVSKPDKRPSRPIRTITALRLRQGAGFRKVVSVIIQDRLSTGDSRLYNEWLLQEPKGNNYSERTAKDYAELVKEWAGFIQEDDLETAELMSQIAVRLFYFFLKAPNEQLKAKKTIINSLSESGYSQKQKRAFAESAIFFYGALMADNLAEPIQKEIKAKIDKILPKLLKDLKKTMKENE